MLTPYREESRDSWKKDEERKKQTETKRKDQLRGWIDLLGRDLGTLQIPSNDSIHSQQDSRAEYILITKEQFHIPIHLIY